MNPAAREGVRGPGRAGGPGSGPAAGATDGSGDGSLDAAGDPAAGGPAGGTTDGASQGYRVRLQDGRDFAVPVGERIHAAARRAGVWLPFVCGWGSCGACKATLVEGEVVSLFPQAPAHDARDERRRRILLCQNTPATDLVLRTQPPLPGPPPERPTTDHRARLVGVEPLGPQVARFRFELSGPGGPAVADYRPGQYAVLELAPGLRRCYSLAGPPGTSRVDVIAKRYPGGRGSGRLFELTPGTTIGMELPYGDFWVQPGDRPLLLVAGGTGVSAILGLLHGLVADPPGPRRPVQVFYGAATRADLVCWDELQALAGRLPGARLHGALLTPDDTWPGARGLITDALAARLPELAGSEVYLAGPPPMAAAVRTLFQEHGWQADQVHADSFG